MINFKAIKPGPYRNKEMLDLLHQSFNEFMELALEDITLVTEGWKGERPTWKKVYKVGATWVKIDVVPTDPESPGAKKFRWLDEGTEAHTIVPKPDNPKGLLFFMSEYTAGSIPGEMRTVPGETGGMLVAAKEVTVSGIEPREWSRIFQEEWQPEFEIWAEDIMQEVAAISGHGKE